MLSALLNWKGLLGALALGLLLGSVGTWRIMSWREQAQETQQAIRTTQLVVKAGDINYQIEAKFVPLIATIHENTQQLISEIPEHVTPAIDRVYPVPLGFVRVWNKASHGAVPEPAIGGDDADSGVPLSDVAVAHTSNEGILDTCRAEVSAWQDWYKQQAANWNKH
jgi:hypothetical protein